MPDSTEWSTKKQTAKMIARTERTVSRIVREAVDMHSDEVLANLKLVYADGHEVEGPNVTAELLTKNEQEGSRTRWFFRRVWWRDVFALRLNDVPDGELNSSDTTQEQQNSGPDRGVGLGDPPVLPSDPEMRALVLEHIHFNDKKHADEIKQLVDRVLQVVETNQQLQGQANTLYNQFQESLKQSGGLKVLADGATQKKARSMKKESPIRDQPSIVVVDSTKQERRPAERHAKRSRKKQKTAAAKTDANQPPASRLQRWFPTFLGAKPPRKK
jgi:hypothetical protein